MSPEESFFKKTPAEDKDTSSEAAESKFFISETTNGETAPMEDDKFVVSETNNEQDIIDIADSIKKEYSQEVSVSNQTKKEVGANEFFVDEEPVKKNTLASKFKKIFNL